MTGVVPAVPTFPAGYAPLTADFDTWIQTPFVFLTSRVMLRAQQQASQSLTGGGFTVVQFGATAGDIEEDPYSGWSTSVTSSQAAYSWLCPVGCSGWYEITMTAFTTNPGTSNDVLQAVTYLDGANYVQMSSDWGVNGQKSGSVGSVLVYLTAGADYVQGVIYTGAATSTPGTAGEYPTMEIVWVST